MRGLQSFEKYRGPVFFLYKTGLINDRDLDNYYMENMQFCIEPRHTILTISIIDKKVKFLIHTLSGIGQYICFSLEKKPPYLLSRIILLILLPM